jgi:hypothetical protein
MSKVLDWIPSTARQNKITQDRHECQVKGYTNIINHKSKTGQAWWHTSIILALEVEAGGWCVQVSLGNIMASKEKTETKQTKKKTKTKKRAGKCGSSGRVPA